MQHFHYYLILGSNLGDRLAQLRVASKYIVEKAGEIISESSIYETQPWGHEDQPWFLNQALHILSPLEPSELMYTIKNIEKEAGRLPNEKWHERHIDIDILWYDQQAYQNDDLIIPHPMLHLRNFALIPLMEIAPFLVHPHLGKTVEELYQESRDPGEVYIFGADEPGDAI
jgi:2-amino-4-hydroxy-6-hydroxymethyldihydropteridine diphosphokinase